MITPADSAPVAPEQMPASSFSITAPDPGASSASPSTIHGLDKSTTPTGDLGTQPSLPENAGAFYDPPRSY